MTSVAAELEAIAAGAADGKLRPDAIVAFARSSNTALHSRFEWDDTAAGHQWRLQQARSIIRVHVIMHKLDPQITVVVPRYVSLSDSRGPDAGYEAVVSVMAQPDRRQVFLRDVINQLSAVTGARLFPAELGEVIAAIEAAQRLYGESERVEAA